MYATTFNFARKHKIRRCKRKGSGSQLPHKFKKKDEINTEDEVQVGGALQFEVMQTKVDVQCQARESDMNRKIATKSIRTSANVS